MQSKATSTDNQTSQAIQTGNIYTSLKAQAIKYAHSLIQAMSEHAENSQFGTTDKADNSNGSSAYFEALRIISSEREEIEINYCNQIEKQLSQFLTASTQLQDKNNESNEFSINQLSLMEEVDLQESLAISTVIEKNRRNYPQDIRSIEKRIAHIYPDIHIDSETSPFDPNALCKAFQDAIHTRNINIRAKVVIYKFFDQQLSKTIGEFYQEINNTFIESGVLPKIKPESPKAISSRLHPHRQKTNDTNSVDTHTADANNSQGHTTETSSEVLVSLQQMLSQTQPAGEYKGNMSSAVDTAETSEQIINALYQIHNEIKNQIQTNQGTDSIEAGSATAFADPQEVSKQFKSMLLNQASQNVGQEVSVNSIDSGIIDIISILFEYILEDKNLPAVAKAQIARLQIPLLKIAILNKELFNTQGHPARLLLNALAKAGLEIDDTDDTKNNPILKKIDYVVHQIINNFENDVQLFSDLLNEFNSFIDEEKERQLSSEAEIVQKKEEKEDISLAKQWVKKTLKDFLVGKKFSEQLEKVIRGPWAQVMLHTYIEQGCESNLWKSQLRFIDVLAWSLDATQISVDHKKLFNIIAQLIKTMRQGLKDINYPEEKTEKLFRALESYHLASIRKIKSTVNEAQQKTNSTTKKPDSFFLFSAVEPVEDNKQNDNTTSPENLNPVEQTIESLEAQVASMSELEAMLEDVMEDPQDDAYDNIEDIVLSDQDALAKPEDHLDDEYLDQARNLKIGTWLEFVAEYGKKQRAKLVWKSEFLGEYTFLNWKFDVVADKSLFVLAADLRTDRARIIDDVPLLDRALTAILAGFRRKSTEA